MVAAATIQRPILNRAQGAPFYSSRRKKTARPTAARTDSRAFLSQPLHSIAMSESPMMKIKTGGICDTLNMSCNRIFSLTGEDFRFSNEDSVQHMIDVIKVMDDWAVKHNLSFTAVKDADDDISFVLYKEMTCLELRVFVYYLSPADYLPKETAELYKRFICYVASSLGISVMPENSDNRYVDMLLFNDCLDEEDHGDIYDLYNNNEKVKKLFEETRDADIGDLLEDLTKHRKVCGPNELDLVEAMIEGMEVMKYISIYKYDFNPYLDGFDDSDGDIELPSTLAILYSSNDGLEEMVLDCINNDHYCGLIPQGWNRWLRLSPSIKREELESLMADEAIEERFNEWNTKFYEQMVKFDLYKKKEDD